MDIENVNDADYAFDLDMCLRLTEALIRLQEILEANPVRSTYAMIGYNTVLFGLIPTIKVKCPHDKDCSVSMEQPVGGFLDALDTLDEAITMLRMECCYLEGGDNDGVSASQAPG